MLRLTLLSQTSVETVLALDGWLMGDDLALLEQEGTRWLQEPGRLVLDLEGVRFIDRESLALLRHWAGSGVVLRGGIPFVRVLLAAHGVGHEQHENCGFAE